MKEVEEMEVMEPAYVVYRFWDCGIDEPYWELEEEKWFSNLVEAMVYFRKTSKAAHKNHRFVMAYVNDDMWEQIMYKENTYEILTAGL
jgi:hypothetical protein